MIREGQQLYLDTWMHIYLQRKIRLFWLRRRKLLQLGGRQRGYWLLVDGVWGVVCNCGVRTECCSWVNLCDGILIKLNSAAGNDVCWNPILQLLSTAATTSCHVSASKISPFQFNINFTTIFSPPKPFSSWCNDVYLGFFHLQWFCLLKRKKYSRCCYVLESQRLL